MKNPCPTRQRRTENPSTANAPNPKQTAHHQRPESGGTTGDDAARCGEYQDELTLAVKGLADTTRQLARAYAQHTRTIQVLQQRVKTLEGQTASKQQK
jgi:hypothetical protein